MTSLSEPEARGMCPRSWSVLLHSLYERVEAANCLDKTVRCKQLPLAMLALLRRNASLNPMHEARLRTSGILACFDHFCRYLDDIMSLNNPHLPRLCYNRNYVNITHATPIHGIYPPCLKITLSASASTLHFMDIEVSAVGPLTTQQFQTTLYDKRNHALKDVPCKRYVHRDSDAPLWCKVNVIVSQFIRFSRLITNLEDLWARCAECYWRLRASFFTQRHLRHPLRRAIARVADNIALDALSVKQYITTAIRDADPATL